jgi:catechol 2,3-dioxygenase-like lactoylglutathione lyase family enzyme
MTAIGRLAVVSLDTRDPQGLANFYCQLLGYEQVFATDEFVALKGPDVGISTQLVKDHVAPDWPASEVPKQLHLEIAVRDLESAEASALALGASKGTTQPNPEAWRVLVDPAGHPFCITTLIPDDF